MYYMMTYKRGLTCHCMYHVCDLNIEYVFQRSAKFDHDNVKMYLYLKMKGNPTIQIYC